MKQPIFSIFLSLFVYMTHAQSSMSDVKSLLKQLTGEFDNFQQVWQEKEDKLPDSLRHEHIHSIFTPTEIPALGQNLLVVKQYRDGDTAKMGRMRIYRFSPDKKEKAIRLDIFTFKNEKTYSRVEHNPLILKDLKLKDFDSANECTIFWKRKKDGFLGYMKSNTCHFAIEQAQGGQVKEDSLQLTKDALWIRDASAGENSKPVFDNLKKIHNKLMRCKPFKGWFAIKQEEKDEKYEFVGNLRLHDQGWKKRVVLPNGTVTPYSIELSQVMYKKSIAVLKLAVYEEGKENAIAYTWTHSEAARIGIHSRKIQAGFTLVNPKH
ncbi:MAG: hypothetical protein RLZZ628_1219 [Bacteroidota bacterium]|jgi:hypothetical protein